MKQLTVLICALCWAVGSSAQTHVTKIDTSTLSPKILPPHIAKQTAFYLNNPAVKTAVMLDTSDVVWVDPTLVEMIIVGKDTVWRKSASRIPDNLADDKLDIASFSPVTGIVGIGEISHRGTVEWLGWVTFAGEYKGIDPGFYGGNRPRLSISKKTLRSA